MSDLLSRAITLATNAHANQTDKAGAPYILHVLRVVTAARFDLDQVVAALHDTLEDTPTSVQDLWDARFPTPVVHAVVALTRDNGEDYSTFIRRIAHNDIARRVKLLDLADNMNLDRLASVSDSDVRRYQKYRVARDFLESYEP